MTIKSYHCTSNANLTAIKTGEGSYNGIFVSLANPCYDYGEHTYLVEFDSICEKSDIQDYIDAHTEILETHPRFNADCDYSDWDNQETVEEYISNQALRAKIAIELGFDAVEENDGFLVVNGKVTYLGKSRSEEVEDFVNDN